MKRHQEDVFYCYRYHTSIEHMLTGFAVISGSWSRLEHFHSVR